ncbi:MAG TPA: peptide deformylase [Flavobacterium sp.]|nr:peptide deformylase [Flavobacterium sp.]
MILPIIGYGDGVLRKKGEDITADYPELKQLLSNMFDTMYNASGVGLAAPQIGLPIRLFTIDTTPFADNDELSKQEQEELEGFKKVFINAKIVKEEGGLWAFNEGCLSIPGIHEDVTRFDKITIEYYDENFVKHTEDYDGLRARVIQHEYDHIEGVLFTDKISSFKKRLIEKKLKNILEGKINTDYRMKFAVKKGR